MRPQQTQSQIKPAQKSKWNPSSSSFAKSLPVTVVLLCGIISGTYLTCGPGFLPFVHHGDNVTEEQSQERLAAFNSLGPLQVMLVTEKEIPGAIEGMQLSAEAKQALLMDPAGAPSARSEQSASSPLPAKDPAANPLHLAWVTLWDSDTEDGDTVRIDSQGYLRTVVLKKAPITFAVPISPNGTINVTGVRDGEGGGITVGLASGASKAVFPIMSEGQVLSLQVRINQ